VIKLLLNRWGILSVDMQQALRADQAVVKESGDFEYVDSPEAEVIPVVSQEKIEEFKELTEAKGFEPILPAFIDEMAKHNKITPEQVMEGALEDFEGFWQYYLVWKLKQPTVENMTTPEPDAPTEAEVQQTLLDRGMVSEKGKGKSK
jgi:hypothetical protein